MPVSPLVRVLSDRGRPLQGLSLSLTLEGGGSIASPSVVTNERGEATLPRWEAPLVAGDFYVTVNALQSLSGNNAAPVTVKVHALVVDSARLVVQQIIGSGGGTISYSSPTSPLNGLTLAVPPSALKASITFTISVRAAPRVASNITPASPLIEIGNGAVVSDSSILIRIPAIRKRGGDLVAFVVVSTSQWIPLAAAQFDGSSVTVGVRRFATPSAISARIATTGSRSASPGASIALFVAELFLPTTGTVSIGFTPGVDNPEFVNRGSYWEPKGYCSGSTILAGWQFLRKSSGVTPLTTREQFPPLLTTQEAWGWVGYRDQLNPSIYLATAFQASLAGRLTTWFRQSAAATWRNILAQLYVANDPVLVVLRNDRVAHAVLAYKVDVDKGSVYVIDPNAPNATDRVIEYDRAQSRFNTFRSGECADCTGEDYNDFADASYFFAENWSDISSIGNQYLDDGLQLQYPGISGRVRLASNQVIATDEEVSRLNAQSRDRVLRFVAQNLGGGTVQWANVWVENGLNQLFGAEPLGSTDDTLRVPLASGENKIGLLFRKPLSDGLQHWYDAKVLIVNRSAPSLTFLTQPASGFVNAPLPTVRVSLVDEDGVVVPEVRQVRLDLIGGTSGAILDGETATTRDDGIATFRSLIVDRAGDRYQLRATSQGLATVASLPFDVRASVTYTVRTSSSPANGGSTSGGGAYTAGSSVTVTATPASGYTFVVWSERERTVSFDASYTFTATEDRSLLANFTPNPVLTVTGSGTGSGVVTARGGFINCSITDGTSSGICKSPFDNGAIVALTATPATGHTFVGWSGACSGLGVCTVSMTQNHTVTATFVTSPAISYTITTSSSPSNGGTTAGGGTYVPGSLVTVFAVASSGYVFVNWMENGSPVSISASYRFTANADRSLVATFRSAQALRWKMSPVSTACSGFSDLQGRRWFEPSFDDTSWADLTPPDVGSFDVAFGGADRFYRGQLTLTSANSQVALLPETDDGVDIYVNGQLVGSFPSSSASICHEQGCVNRASTCFINLDMPSFTVPANLLRAGENVVGVHVSNGFGPSYFDMKVIVDGEVVQPAPTSTSLPPSAGRRAAPSHPRDYP